MKTALKILCIFLALATPMQMDAQLGKVLVSVTPGYHFTHSGVLGKFKSGPGAYLRIYSVSSNFYLESGYVNFKSKDPITAASAPSTYTMDYSNYSAIPISLGYLLELNSNKKYLIQAGFFGGYWYSYYNYHFRDQLTTETGVTGSNKFHMGANFSYNRRYGNVSYGVEARYTALLPINPLQDLNFEGLLMVGLSVGYIF